MSDELSLAKLAAKLDAKNANCKTWGIVLCREIERLAQENAKLREAATLFRLYGLPPHDVSGVAAWDKAIKLLEGGAK